MASTKLKAVILLHATLNVGLLILFIFSGVCILLLSVRPGWTYWYTYPTWIIAFFIYNKYMKKLEGYLIKNKDRFFPQDQEKAR
jgi:hypothetical protein